MKTPEEIKKGLECCINCDCDNCHYRELKLDCGDYLKADSILLINQLEKREWELFSLLSSAFYGMQCYFKQDGEVKPRYFKVDDGLVYSRVTGKYLSFDQAIDEFAEMLTGEDEAQSGTDTNVPRWISVEERLPEKEERVLFFAEEPRLTMDTACGWWVNTTNRYKITHWMPLPEPPKEG